MKKVTLIGLLALSILASCQNENGVTMRTVRIMTDTGEYHEIEMMIPDTVKVGEYYKPKGSTTISKVIK